MTKNDQRKWNLVMTETDRHVRPDRVSPDGPFRGDTGHVRWGWGRGRWGL